MSARRRGATALAALAVTSLLATACGAGGGGDGGDQITLQIWDFSSEQVDFHEKVAATFTEEHPGITIEWRSIAQDEYGKTLPLAFQSRQAPEIFYWSDGGVMNMNQLLAQGWIQPLHPDGEVPAEFTERFPAGSFVEGINVSEGETYGFPFSENLYWGPGYMYLNNQVFAAAGLDPANPPRTWSELEAACAQVVNSTEAECIAAPTKGDQLQRAWYALAGGTMTDLFFDHKNGKFALDDPKLLETHAFLQRLKEQGYLAPGTNDKNFSRRQFAASQAAIYFDGTWMPSVWAKQGFTSDKYTVAGHPNPDGGPTGALARQHNGNKYWVSSQTEHHEAAWTFLEWMTRPDGPFVQEYYKQGFGTLAFADNEKLVTDPALKQIMQFAQQPGFRVRVPVPVLKCPDLAQSEAYLDATTMRPDWEFEVMNQALVSGEPLAPLAQELVAERQEVLESTLAEEAANGLDVSIDCFTFPDWEYTADYPIENYAR